VKMVLHTRKTAASSPSQLPLLAPSDLLTVTLRAHTLVRTCRRARSLQLLLHPAAHLRRVVGLRKHTRLAIAIGLHAQQRARFLA